MNSLPEGISIRPGEISVIFPPDDPTLGAKRLHELALAMLNDWEGFRRKAGSAERFPVGVEIDFLTAELEELKRRGESGS